jgi:signal transduction histidine kinase
MRPLHGFRPPPLHNLVNLANALVLKTHDRAADGAAAPAVRPVERRTIEVSTMQRDPGGVRTTTRALPFLVCALLVCGTVAMAGVVQGVVNDQEDRLLDQRAQAAGALVSTSFGGLTSTLPLLGALAQPGLGSPALFDGVAKQFARKGGAAGTAVRTNGRFVVQRSVGEGPAADAVLTGVRAALVARARTADGLVSTVQPQGGGRRLMFAVVSPSDPEVVVYAEFQFDPAALTKGSNDGPFSELEGAIYVGRTADADALLLSTTPLPLSGGPTATRTVDVGADPWLLVVTPKGPLVGGFAKSLPWLVLAFGLVTTLLVSLLAWSISRRRAYAMRVVDERTAELRTALAEQERLEEGQRIAREAAEEANRAKSDFLSRMSHELRTPLNAVLGFAQLLETEDLDEDGHDSVKQILRGGRHLLDLINEVLDITRIETGTFQLSPEPVLAEDILDDVLHLTAPLAQQQNIHLIRGSSTGSDLHVLADYQRLKQVLLNLISNAIKYNRPGGTVAISCEELPSSRMRLRVLDTGPGIRPEQRDLLFTLFERLGAEQTSIEGTGVGLALSRRLAEAMGGTVDVESTVGQGSTFWVELPIVEGPVERFERFNSSKQQPAVREIDEASSRAKVLYIEDNLLNLRLVKRILDDHPDIELITAMQGRLGFELAREHQPKLVLLDLHLSDIGGDEVLRQLRDDPQTSAIPVVVVSADATAGQMRRLLAEGASSYLTKPLDVQALRDLLDGVPTG